MNRRRGVESRKGAAPGGPFPLPAHQTGRADLQHPAFRRTSRAAHAGQRRTVLIRWTPSLPNTAVTQLVRSKGPWLRRHYPASPLPWPFPRPKPADALPAPFGLAPLAPGFPLLPGLPSLHAVPTTPADRIGACRFLLVRSRTGFFPTRSGLPGAHIRPASTDLCFEACSGFTHVTACRFARPPYVDFVTRLQPEWSPIRTARQLPRHIDSSWRGTFTHW